ncbi:hypothetical protein Goarm_006054 [Gossypium armourianum]|uniref:Uncharacterized protein n=1 Tax=Gossypium armourianum TaxID=34283 RepID=A0A7J9JIG8_9ROSI|nr:hypothetical protein [Gossypium armourianum]
MGTTKMDSLLTFPKVISPFMLAKTEADTLSLSPS